MKSKLSKLLVALALTALFVYTIAGVNATWAQDATSEPVAAETVDAPVIVDVGDNVVSVETPPESITLIRNENPVLVTVIMVAGLIIAVFGAGLIYQGRLLFQAASPELQALLVHNRPVIEAKLETGFSNLLTWTNLTPNQLDDLVVKYGHDFVFDFLRKVYGDDEAVG